MKIGIRREDKGQWERRAPLVPDDLRALKAQGVECVVQSSSRRAIGDDEYVKAGIPVRDNLEDCRIIFGIKEIPKETFEPGKAYVFFSHVIKGQPYNMPMLKRMMDLKATLFDYERIVDEKNRRLIFFGRHAGLAGMINTLWSLGQRLTVENIANPFSIIRQARSYHDLAEARRDLAAAAEAIRNEGIPPALRPLVVGITGYGNVSRGAQEILDQLPVKTIRPADLAALERLQGEDAAAVVFKAVFTEADMVEPLVEGVAFDLQNYFTHGKERYRSSFNRYLEALTVLVNCIYWDPRYPRLMTLEDCRRLWEDGRRPRLRVIGDISCDPDGSIQCNQRATDPGAPTYVYEPATGRAIDGFDGHGPVIMAVDILPAEIPRESSDYFSGVLKPYVPTFAGADFTVPFGQLALPPELKRAAILYHGRLTEPYRYLEKFLAAGSGSPLAKG